ncbi:DNA helicase [Lacrimispora amygdalina]|uniref:DNA helicase n=1 Tax=Lacrimispora amygdalina TaxID=253257 RepID=A0ABQ5M5Q9_9FIRM
MNNQSDILYLEEINRKVNDALEKADADVRRLDENYMEFKRYMVQNRGEIDPHEMFQNEMELNRMDNTTALSASIRDKLLKLKDSPYFARIDFKENNSCIPGKYYIGRFSFRYGNELLIFDWRAPISSMFYDYEIGPAGFDAPSGRIEGQLTEKRQFKIKNGKLEYALQSSLTIQDDILQQELSHTSDEKMKSIITTIQKEQNQIIRNENSRTLIIQGVAGSGKTSIALHRIAFLLYRFKDRLSADHVGILSPNRVFGNYISEVLPELGEEPVCELGFTDIAREQIGNLIGFETDRVPSESNDSAWMERVRFKSALSFVKQMDDFISAAPGIIFDPADFTYGRFTADADTIKKRFDAYGNFPVRQRLKMIASDIYERFHSDNYMGDDIPKSSTILKALNKMIKIKNTLSLYKEFYKYMNKTELFIMPSKNTLEWADVFPFLYLYNFYEGLQENRLIRHLVIDEMQDYTPIQYVVINILFHCPKTILGDFGQFINPSHAYTLDDLKSLYEGSDFIELTKSYRSTYEIISFAMQIKNTGTIKAIERHGTPPAIIRCQNKNDELLTIRNKIEAFLQSSYSSLAIITKTSHDGKLLYDQLSGDYEVHFISTDSTEFKSGITVTSIQMSKGLEFDEVIIPYADSVCYSEEHDRNLLYIACTRAMHRLTLFYTGEISPLLKPENQTNYNEKTRLP